MDEQLRRYDVRRSLSFADIRAAHTSGQPTVIQAVEGCHFLEGRLDRIGEAYRRGLRHIGLFHDTDSAPSLGDVATRPARLRGLTALGRT